MGIYFFKHLADVICFHSVPCTNYQSQKSCPDVVFEPAVSHLLFNGHCTLPIPLALKLMVATLRASEIIGLDGEGIQFITPCQQYHCCIMTRQEFYLMLRLEFHGHSLKLLQEADDFFTTARPKSLDFPSMWLAGRSRE